MNNISAIEMFVAMATCKPVEIVGTRLDLNNQISEEWDTYSRVHGIHKGQIVSMMPESSGGKNWIMNFRMLYSRQVVKLYVYTKESGFENF